LTPHFFRLVLPIAFGELDIGRRGRHLTPKIFVTSGLEEQDFPFFYFGKTISDNSTGRSSADDNEVVFSPQTLYVYKE
jgi:hypothetical protein